MLTAVLLCGLQPVEAQRARSESFHQRYKLKEVVALSRHNIRAPLSGHASALGRLTPHEWFEWSSAPSELSLRGGVLETMMGQFFRKWLVSEGLMEECEQPAPGAMRFYANSMQRTIATAQYFSSGMLPVANVAIEHHFDVGTMDPVFKPQLTKVDNDFRKLALSQIARMGGRHGMAGLGEKVRGSYALMERVLDMEHGAACQQGDTCGFRTDDTAILLEVGEEPRMTGSLKLACSVSDALLLQYYEEPDAQKAAFGHELSFSDWDSIAGVKDWYGDILFTAPAVAVNVAHPLLQEILCELQNENRRFVFLCGHDSNIGSVLAAIGADDYVLPHAIESKTPIGSKLVIEKWVDTDGREFAALHLVYQRVDQLRGMSMLSRQNPPEVFGITLNGLTANADGLYPLAHLRQRLEESIDAYDNLPPKKVANVINQ